MTATISLAGCGSGSDSQGFGLAGFASPGSLIFVEGKLKPTGTQKSNLNSAAYAVAGIGDLGEFVASELARSARQRGEPFDFAGEVKPWLGERAAVAFRRIEHGDLSAPLIAIETTDPKATEKFVKGENGQAGAAPRDVTYEGVDFKVDGDDGDAIGVIDEALVIARSEDEFKAAVNAAAGDSLDDEGRFQDAVASAPNGGVANAYIDLGGLLAQSENGIGPRLQGILGGAGIDPSEATAVASLIPKVGQVEISLNSNLGAEAITSGGDVSKLLGSVPATSFAAFAFSGIEGQLKEAIDNLDQSGIPPDLPPHELKSALGRAGIDLDKIAASLVGGAVFFEGSSKQTFGGALVLTTDGSDEASGVVAGLDTLLRGSKVPGVSVIRGKEAGFSISSRKLGSKPIVVIAKGNRISIGYGRPAALAGLGIGSNGTLSGGPDYRSTAAALGGTPIVAYANGPAARNMAEALVPRSNTDFWRVVPYLKFTGIGLGASTDGGLSTLKLIAGLGG